MNLVSAPAEHHVLDTKFLNRRISWRSHWLEMEADSKYVPTMLNEWGMTQCRGSEVPYRTSVPSERGIALPEKGKE